MVYTGLVNELFIFLIFLKNYFEWIFYLFNFKLTR